ncbi:MAG: asparagine synthase (glutamine-hydrolyzing) [Deltaproteobacteria bacterium]|nr:asparagine synthase (glutamine-hydrolyzing) [Deltaproteobacteria bacterium]
MCGICGIVNLDGRPVDEALLRKMNRTMVHRGPDGEGYYINAGRREGWEAGKGPGNVGLGHRRLSIIDLEGGRQPMGNEDGSVQVVFNGEIYNFLELKAILESRGHRFRTRSDTESIVHGYEEWGEGVFERLRGMFGIAIWDERRKRLLIARDRVGKKPLYYSQNGKTFSFASELKALLEDSGIPKDIDYRALDCYLSYGYVPSPLSIFRAIKKLPPAHYAVLERGELSVKRYWDLDMSSASEGLTEREAVEKLQELFFEAVGIRLISDVPLGAFLSGGVDSSVVVAAMAELDKGHPVKTASIGFSDKRYDELDYARVVAERYGTDHSEYVVEPRALDVLNKIVWHLDEPFADSSSIPTYYVCEMARRKVTVALSGDGGDETFAGYVNRYYMSRLEDRFRNALPVGLRRALLSPVARIYPRLDNWPRAFRLKNFLTSISSPLEIAYYRAMSFYFLPEAKRRLYRPETAMEIGDFDSSDILGNHFRENRNPDVTSRVQYVDIKTYLPEDILVKVDRMSMAHSLEVRAPLLDHKIMEYMGGVPSTLKLKGGVSKYILKKAMEDRLPRDVLYRGKQGFCVPLAEWLRGDLKDLIGENLLCGDSRIREYFQIPYVRSLWNRHLSGKQDNSAPIWGLLMFELWHRRFLG